MEEGVTITGYVYKERMEELKTVIQKKRLQNFKPFVLKDEHNNVTVHKASRF